MRKLVTAFAVTALLALAPSAAHAQVQIGPTVAIHGDADLGIGAAVAAQAPGLGTGIGFLADLLFFFPDGFDYLEINGNITYDLPIADSSVLPFVLGGVNIARASVDANGLGSASNTEIGINLGGGIVFDVGRFRPSAGLRVEVDGGDSWVLFATLPFEVGGN